MDNKELIEALLNCANGEEPAILRANQNLIDARLVQTMLDYATNLATRNDIQTFERLIKIVVFNLLVTLKNGNFGSQEFSKAIEYYEQLLTICQERSYQQIEMILLCYIRFFYRNTHNYAKAIESSKRLLAIAQSFEKPFFQAETLFHLGIDYQGLWHLDMARNNLDSARNNLDSARNNYERGLAIAEQIDIEAGKKLLVDILNALGRSYNPPYSWDKDKAIDICTRSLGIAQEIGYRHGEAVALTCIGKAHYSAGGESRNFPEAIKCYEPAKVIFQETGDLEKEVDALYHLQDSYYYTSNYGEAIKLNEERLAIARDLKNDFLEASALFCLGTDYQALDQLAEAKKYYQQSLNITNELDIEAGGELKISCLQGLGGYHTRKRELAEAEKYYQDSLDIAEKILDIAKKKNDDRFREMALQKKANALQPLAGIYYNRGELDQALSYNKQSLEIKLRLKDQIGTGNSIGFRGSIYLARGEYPEALNEFKQSLEIMKQLRNYSGEASTLTDIGLALLYLGQIEEAEHNLREGINLWESVRGKLEDRDDFKVSIFEQQARTYQLLQATLIDREKPLAALEIAERGRARALVELLSKDLEGQLAEKREITSPTLQQIQQIAKEQNATLVEYSILWSSTLLIWVIKPTVEIAFRLVDLKPLLQEFNTSLEDLVAIARQSIGATRTRFVGSDGDDNDNEIIQGNNKQLQQLYQILIEPITEFLPKDADERVIFIPQNSLFLVPFPALQDASGKYLISQHTILTAPSIQVLEITRQHQQRVQKMELQDVLVVGNPTMPPFKSHQLIPLPGAEQEAKQIAPLLNTEAFIGSEATKVAIVERMPTARIIHLATHGLLDDADELKVPGAIALAPSGTDDGWLTATEIMNLKMLKAELVVLSACNTGQGRLTGDGVIGLSRSFISRGVPSVIASLWSVPDAPTASFMVEFYQNLQRGDNKAQALRQAMLTIKEKHPNPIDWAAFTLIGEASQSIFQKAA
ncbi:CHAT domain-containing protein [Plectonema radiosum NIES-515]|uniref:CHAT domain-containing protein n=1 Tax=Plectonema radiosum NIES-515 TaxID=2986073 RepID=A0ABT3B7X5_9CYAN|nr:CHAT domain-containing tetratricopeptide repeat protein [Plectonema radiosum]MCV3217490.1 CHAT domain-containing protein [Plectonema radiosum NIES-515]